MSLTDEERRANLEWTARARALGPNSVLLYSCANAPYQDFVPLFAFSALALDPRFAVEAGVQDSAAFTTDHGPALDLIEQTFPGRFTWRAVSWKQSDGTKLRPHVVRFVTPPRTEREYVFISDIDFVFLNRDLIDQHFRIMGRLGLPYSNSVRPGTRRTSGLHFTRWDALYPLPDLSGLDLHHANDEENLSAILQRKGLPLQDKVWERPSPGVHISPSREMNPSEKDGRRIPGWSWQPFAAEHQAFWAREDARALRPLLSARLREALDRLDQAIAAHLDKSRRRERRALRDAQPRRRQHREGDK